MKIYIIFCLFYLFLLNYVFSQTSWCTVTTVQIPNRCIDGEIVDLSLQESQKEFVFDSFAKWKSGITLYGGSIIKIIAKQDTSINAPPLADPPCFWKLLMQIDNTGGLTPSDEWKTEDSYGTVSGDKPSIDMLQIRVDNGCHTPQVTGFQSFSSHEDILPIIDPPSGVNTNIGNSNCSSGSDNAETNGAGTYLGPDYNEFSFTVDYKIVPQVGQIPGLAPGRYTLVLKFCLSEQ